MNTFEPGTEVEITGHGGVGGHEKYWDKWVGYRAVVIDRPTHGKSVWVRGLSPRLDKESQKEFLWPADGLRMVGTGPEPGELVTWYDPACEWRPTGMLVGKDEAERDVIIELPSGRSLPEEDLFSLFSLAAQPKLTLELVPSTAWWSNVRSNVSRNSWEICKKTVRERSGDRCEVCGGHGRRWPVECHEVWHYNHTSHVQTLINLIALCPACHEVKHMGRAEAVGRGTHAMGHLAQVNGWTEDYTQSYRDAAFFLWHQRSRMGWKLDISFLGMLGIAVTLPVTRGV